MVSVPVERIVAMTEQGLWRGKVLTEFLDKYATEAPDTVAIFDSGQGVRLTYRQLLEKSSRIAAGLAVWGIGKGDVVSVQLPNWWQLTAVHLACLRLGAVTNPLMPGLRERELSFMLRLARSKVMIIPSTFRNFDHKAMLAALQVRLPDLSSVFVIGDDVPPEFLDFNQLLLEAELPELALGTVAKPNDVIQLLFTSGTTGEPKGVLHISNTILSHSIALSERMHLTEKDAILAATPMTHQTGFIYGIQLPIIIGAKSVLQESWNPGLALDLIDGEEVTFSMGATPFLADLVAHPNAHLAKEKLKLFLSGGAPIPAALARRAGEVLGTKVIAMWGMTENAAVTTTLPEDPEEKIFNTDGLPMPGMDIKVVDDKGNELPPDSVGLLKCRGPNNFVGYLNRPDLRIFDEEQWFETGDLARIDRDGYVRITGRAKDVIIRGGENVPVVEVESVLFRHPSIARVAIVAFPDERLGERACAFVITKPGQRFDLAEMRRYLGEQQMMRNYWPERVEVVAELPMTESGKIQKNKLREIAKNFRLE